MRTSAALPLQLPPRHPPPPAARRRPLQQQLRQWRQLSCVLPRAICQKPEQCDERQTRAHVGARMQQLCLGAHTCLPRRCMAECRMRNCRTSSEVHSGVSQDRHAPSDALARHSRHANALQFGQHRIMQLSCCMQSVHYMRQHIRGHAHGMSEAAGSDSIAQVCAPHQSSVAVAVLAIEHRRALFAGPFLTRLAEAKGVEVACQAVHSPHTVRAGTGCTSGSNLTAALRNVHKRQRFRCPRRPLRAPERRC